MTRHRRHVAHERTELLRFFGVASDSNPLHSLGCGGQGPIGGTNVDRFQNTLGSDRRRRNHTKR